MRCPFCQPNEWEVFHTGRLILGIWNTYPATPGHAMLITRRHVEDWFEASAEEQQELSLGAAIARRAILERYQPDGFNLGVNCGRAGGQTVFHLHLHVVPRYLEQALDLSVPEVAAFVPPQPVRRLVTDDFEEKLALLLTRARVVDLAVARPKILEPALRQLLERGGRLRLISGQALELPGGEVRMHNDPDFQLRVYRIQDREGNETAFLQSGEWGYRLAPLLDREGQREVRAAFEKLWDTLG